MHSPSQNNSNSGFFNTIFSDLSIMELKEIIESLPDREKAKKQLHEEFLKYCYYNTAEEWNRAVRLCECLAIIGWGEVEGVEALKGRWVNGYPSTGFFTSRGEQRYRFAVWVRKNGGITIDPYTLRDQTDSQIKSLSRVVSRDVKLASQRNWLPKCPVECTRVMLNCYPGSAGVVKSIVNDLNRMLMDGMRPERYGNLINYILIFCVMSFYDNDYCKTNLVIADENMKLKKNEYDAVLHSMFSSKEIEDQGLYLRPRYEIGPLRKDTGKVYVTISFEKEFSFKSEVEQKRLMAHYFLTAVKRIADRQKKSAYNFDLMLEDFGRILNCWVNSKSE